MIEHNLQKEGEMEELPYSNTAMLAVVIIMFLKRILYKKLNSSRTQAGNKHEVEIYIALHSQTIIIITIIRPILLNRNFDLLCKLDGSQAKGDLLIFVRP